MVGGGSGEGQGISYLPNNSARQASGCHVNVTILSFLGVSRVRRLLVPMDLRRIGCRVRSNTQLNLCQPRTLVRGSGFSNPRKCSRTQIEGFSPGGGDLPNSIFSGARCEVRRDSDIANEASPAEPALSLSNGDGTTCSPARQCRVGLSS